MKLTRNLCLMLLFGAGAAHAQDEEQGPPPEPTPPSVEELLAPNEDPRAELVRLFHKVERSLDEISDVLFEAGAGSEDLEEVADSGLDELLRQTGQKSEQVVSDIDRILRVAEELAQQQQSGSGQGGPPSGESPLDKPGQSAPRQREDTPQGPRPEDGQPEGQDGQQPKDQPGDDGKPESPNENPEGGENREAEPDQREPGDAVPRADDRNRWGMLPERVRETFRNQGRDDLPVQYREWIDSYYRRLNERP